MLDYRSPAKNGHCKEWIRYGPREILSTRWQVKILECSKIGIIRNKTKRFQKSNISIGTEKDSSIFCSSQLFWFTVRKKSW